MLFGTTDLGQNVSFMALAASIFKIDGYGIFQLAADGHFLAVNPAMAHMLGYDSTHQLLSEITDLRERLCLEPETFLNFMKEIAHTDVLMDRQIQIYRKDGSLIQVLCSIRIVRDLENEIFCYEGMIRDVTQLFRIEQSLRELSPMVEKSEDAIVIKALDGTVLQWNAGAESIYGYSAQEIVGRPITVLFPPERVDEFHFIMKKINKGEALPFYETVRVSKEGKRIHVGLTISPITNQQGIIVAITSIARNITGRKTMESLLYDSELKYRTLVESMSEGLLQVNHRDEILFVNEQLCRMFGYESTELLGKIAYEMFMHPKDHAFIKEKNILRSRGLSDKYSIRMITKSGEIIWVEVAGAPVRDSSGIITGSIAVLTDITDRKRIEDERKQLVKQIKEKHRNLKLLSAQLVRVQELERRKLAGELHDEIGQILTAVSIKIRIPSQTISHQIDANLKQARDLLDDLTNRIRELSLQLRPAILDDIGLLPAVLWHLDRFTSQTGLTVEFKHSGIENLRFDREVETAAYRILQEALTNVGRHAGACEVAVKVRRNKNQIDLEISDNGAGFSVRRARMSPKDSIGLTGMRERAELLGGKFRIRSNIDEGTVVRVRLPYSTDKVVI